MELQFDLNNPKYEYITTNKRALEVLDILSKEKILGVDTEATGLDPYTNILLLVQIGTAKVSYLFDARKLDLKSIDLYRKIMESPEIIKIFHNSVFDYKQLKHHTKVEIKNIFDVMLAESTVTAGLNLSVSLKEILIRYIGPEISDAVDKTVRLQFVGMTKNQKFTEEQLRYSGLDTLLLFPVLEQQLKLLSKHNVMNIAKLEFATAPVVAEMELRGIYLNEKKWREIIKNLEVKKQEILEQFHEEVRPYYNTKQNDLFGNAVDSININSQQQLLDLFNNKLNLNMPSTGSAVLKNYAHPAVQLLAKYRGYEKLISSFGDSVLEKINPVTRRIHPQFVQFRAATGRFACNNPNIQQIPRNSEDAPFRECFNPAPGYKLVVSDYSQIEMRILAEVSGDVNLRKAYTDDLDLHSYTAALMFNKPYTKDFKDKYPKYRQMAKPLNFGIMYGLSPIGLHRQMLLYGSDIPVDECEELIDKYFKGYPGVKKYLDRQSKFVMKQGFSTTLGGRKRWYKIPSKNDPEYRRKMSGIQNAAKNHPIQGTNADAIKFALVFVNERIKKEGIDGGVILTVHDEIACEIREDQADEFANILSEEMVKAGELYIKDVPVKSDPFVGDVWEH